MRANSANSRSAFTVIGVDHDRAKSACWREGRNWQGDRSGGCDGDDRMVTDRDAPCREDATNP